MANRVKGKRVLDRKIKVETASNEREVEQGNAPPKSRESRQGYITDKWSTLDRARVDMAQAKTGMGAFSRAFGEFVCKMWPHIPANYLAKSGRNILDTTAIGNRVDKGWRQHENEKYTKDYEQAMEELKGI